MSIFHQKLTQEVIGAAFTVANKLKPGPDEKLYERALVLELAKRGHPVEQQRAFTAYYDGVEIGHLVTDLIVDGILIVDPKVVSDFNEAHIAQMLGYLNITGLRVALLLNFKKCSVTWKRIVR
jgi:GxxExxY protein